MPARRRGATLIVKCLGAEIALDAAERERVAKLIIEAVRKDGELDWIDRVYALAMAEMLLPVPPRRPVERASDRAARWYRNPTNQAAAMAAWKERAWRKHNKVNNNRVVVKGKSIPIHIEAARRAIEHCQRRSSPPFKTNVDAVVALLRRGRTSPSPN
jgi:hypothetical protein